MTGPVTCCETSAMNLFSLHGEAALRLRADGTAEDTRISSANEERALGDLARLGFVHAVENGLAGRSWRWNGTQPAGDRALLALLARFDLDLEVGLAADDVVWIAAAVARPVAGQASGHAFCGTGFGPAEAVRASLGEFAETQSWLYRPDDGGRRCNRRALGAAALDPWHILGFSQEQRARRVDLNEAWRDYDSIPQPSAFGGEIDWSAVEALSDRSVRWLPSQVCFGRYAERAQIAGDGWRADSNGCAAGRTFESAVSRALLELVERDATGIWWYGRISRPALARSIVEDDPLDGALARRAQMGQQAWLLDLTHDLEIPVVAAILADQAGALLALGFGAEVDSLRAARSAYREMCQMELSVALVRRRAGQMGEAARPEDRRLLHWMSAASIERLPHLRPATGLTARMIAAQYDAGVSGFILERLYRAGLEAFAIDLQRPDIGIPAIRAFVPGLCHFKPRLGHRRLIDVPRALHWRDPDFNTRDLNETPLLI
jgi:ribosomal protein S12 methylthiotransferase accessory factor